ncbi:hypothetical protein Pla110_29780 [Polystyrenella longa]|uniref:Uncharacterized protein n=1 Tax=Polystyrenella longa TaxID=2528007 RepID=A0A518CPU2_9PLAN|nr:hypothetical protein [Polystyrenella longa]QDU81239.1 hypothetical protein Pla110_29780 [Polystyrenella longa]
MSKLSGHWTFSLVALFAATSMVVAGTEAFAAGKNKLDIVKNSEYDPNAEQVELFNAMEDGKVESKLVLKDSKGGRLLVTNNTQQPLSVSMPKAMVGVQVLKQLGGLGGQSGGQGGFGSGGQAQSTGGGINGGTGGNTGGLGGNSGGSLFSIPASKTLSLDFNSVCLEHGKAEPASRMEYTVAPVATFSEDPVLERLLVNVAEQRIDNHVAQAAAWHLASEMSWGDLAAKSVKHLGGLPATSYFSRAQLSKAQQAVSVLTFRVQQEAEENKNNSESEEVSETPEPAPADRVSLAR